MRCQTYITSNVAFRSKKYSKKLGIPRINEVNFFQTVKNLFKKYGKIESLRFWCAVSLQLQSLINKF